MSKNAFIVLIAMITSVCHAENDIVNHQQNEQQMACYTAEKLSYRILRDKYRNIPIEQSAYYKINKASSLLVEEIYALPFETEATAREKQVEMVTNLVLLGCYMATSKEN